MKNRKGFSLVELIAVIIIIGIIGIISIPVVSNFINSSQEQTYRTYEKSMANAAENEVIKCESDPSFTCVLPDTVNEKKRIQLNQLIDNGFIDNMKNPDSEEFCDGEKSYVEVTKTGMSDYEYVACLHCGEYVTKDVCSELETDGDEPVCGDITGASTRWTNQDRTISVKCSDDTSGCAMPSFSRTFTTTTEKSHVTIQDKSGRTKQCEVNVYVDKTLPTCEMEIIDGEYIESVGWYSLTATAKLTSTNDEHSKVLTYGVGTSLENRNYNKETELTVGSGITTVLGYVKDVAGNEGVCGVDVRVGTSKPDFKFYYGYPVYPNKEGYALSQITEQTGNVLKTTGNDPKITLERMSHYGQIEKVRVTLSQNIATSTKATVLSNGTEIGQATMTRGTKIIEVNIPKNNYNTLTIRLGELNNKTYKVSKIEVLTADGSTVTNQSVTVYVEKIDKGARTIAVSFNNGRAWQEEMFKTYANNTTDIIKTKNVVPMESDPKIFNITGIDKVVPTVKITAKKKTSGTTVEKGVWSDEGLNYKFTLANNWINRLTIYYCTDRNNTCNPTTTATNNTLITELNGETGVYYVRYKTVSTAGKSSSISTFTAKVDTEAPKCTILKDIAENTQSNITLNIINGTSISGIYQDGYSWESATTGFSNTKTKVVSENGTYTAWVKAKNGKTGSCNITVNNIKRDYTVTFSCGKLGNRNHPGTPPDPVSCEPHNAAGTCRILLPDFGTCAKFPNSDYVPCEWDLDSTAWISSDMTVTLRYCKTQCDGGWEVASNNYLGQACSEYGAAQCNPDGTCPNYCCNNSETCQSPGQMYSCTCKCKSGEKKIYEDE